MENEQQMKNETLIENEIEIIKKSIDTIKTLCTTRPQAYNYKNIIERYVFNKLFYFFFE